jgi:hypothetical protein
MKVYLVWSHEQYEPSYLMGIYADKQMADEECAHYAMHEDRTDVWYDVKEDEVIT